ncbi:hydroxyacid dehydrogenase [Rhizobium leguminosarum]|uniref:hydroxyacid dehydrogenase n=1 Tax=Rhizobium leguminosarum TaxID=384 RepID=UPI00143F602C|nr:hydroxyacid dehydrogenase [Rhizobium leguminosarum]NKK63646.1 dehydrogenase [Rhizobium leguminosarum bv. viciae]NKL04010.1 dehydrogenase [Rhizobium leguminosarum bv. viciae]NKL81811.1 dehydrogenase [Rhizobium leguminosarum bv. viciae]NKL89174.1 dehydrogenase [Rhizobium leguminosarum bv. viciae]NKM89704.1 dehydrogenase [Rhizobium leguminosarum bv. viciae]
MSFIFSTHPLHPAARSMLEAADLRVASAPDPETLLREGRGAGIVIIRAPIPPAFFENAPALRAAIRHGAGLDMVPIDAATRAGVLVANVPGANASTVAEHVFLVTLALLRRFRLMDRELRQNGWAAGRAQSDTAVDLAGRTMGIVGMGNVGKAIFKIAKFGFGLDVVVTSRSPESVPDGVHFLTIDELVATADIVVLCCPLTPETTGLLNAGRIGRMKPAAILVNVSRGPVIDDAALVEALRDGRIGGAALDVFATQPLPLDHPYFGFDNVIVTPHLAGLTEESMIRMGTGAASEALRVIKGDLPVNLRNPEVVEHYRRRFPA